MSSKAKIIATLTSDPEVDLLESLAGTVDILEVRGDVVGELDVDHLRAHFAGELLYTLRSLEEGGLFDGGDVERAEKLAAAASRYDLVDLESSRDADWDGLASLPPARRISSWHGSAHNLGALRSRLEETRRIESRWYKLVPYARSYSEAKLPLALLEAGRGDDIVAFAGGRLGSWTRLISARVGASVVYAAIGEGQGAPGQPSLSTLIEDYGVPQLHSISAVFGVVGNPVEHSLSPRLHNGLYRALGVDALYVAFHVEEFGQFWLEMVEGGVLARLGMPLRGLSVTAPHKEIALAVAGASSPLAARVGAANTLVRRLNVWEAETSDPEGVVMPFEERGFDLRGKRAIVLGAGGAGRSAAVGLAEAGAEVELVNRTESKGIQVARELGLTHVPWGSLDERRYAVLVNATPLGRRAEDACPFEVDRISAGSAVLDMAYSGGSSTSLAAAARAAGLEVIEGREMLLCQASRQFRMMTGLDVPRDEAARILGVAPR